MASNLSDFIGGGAKPKLITPLTSGTGTYIPLENNSRCFIRRQGAGGGGGAGISGGSGAGGGAGAQVDSFERVPITGITYAIGAKGVGASDLAGTDGSVTRVGNIAAPGGKGGGRSGSAGAIAGSGAYLISGDTATGNFGLLNGVSGGAGGYAGAIAADNKGWAPGFTKPATTGSNGQSTGATNAGGGGDSAMGKGGNGVANGPGGNASGYGAGGGGSRGTGAIGGDGTDGYAEIWDYGA